MEHQGFVSSTLLLWWIQRNSRELRFFFVTLLSTFDGTRRVQ